MGLQQANTSNYKDLHEPVSCSCHSSVLLPLLTFIYTAGITGPKAGESPTGDDVAIGRLKKRNIADVERKCVWHGFLRMMPCAKFPR